MGNDAMFRKQVKLEMLGPVPPPEFRGNGMGTDGLHWLVRWLLWFAADVMDELDHRPARYHDWFYLTGGQPTPEQIAEWRAAWAAHGGHMAEEHGELFFDGGDSFARMMADGLLEINVRNLLFCRWGRIRWFLLSRLTVWAVFRAVRDFGAIAWNERGRRT